MSTETSAGHLDQNPAHETSGDVLVPTEFMYFIIVVKSEKNMCKETVLGTILNPPPSQKKIKNSEQDVKMSTQTVRARLSFIHHQNYLQNKSHTV